MDIKKMVENEDIKTELQVLSSIRETLLKDNKYAEAIVITNVQKRLRNHLDKKEHEATMYIGCKAKLHTGEKVLPKKQADVLFNVLTSSEQQEPLFEQVTLDCGTKLWAESIAQPYAELLPQVRYEKSTFIGNVNTTETIEGTVDDVLKMLVASKSE